MSNARRHAEDVRSIIFNRKEMVEYRQLVEFSCFFSHFLCVCRELLFSCGFRCVLFNTPPACFFDTFLTSCQSQSCSPSKQFASLTFLRVSFPPTQSIRTLKFTVFSEISHKFTEEMWKKLKKKNKQIRDFHHFVKIQANSFHQPK